jgi:hypothetical protein
VQMDDLNCLQAQTIGRSWQSNSTESASQRDVMPVLSSAVQRDQGPSPKLCVRHQFATTSLYWRWYSREPSSHLVDGDMHDSSSTFPLSVWADVPGSQTTPPSAVNANSYHRPRRCTYLHATFPCLQPFNTISTSLLASEVSGQPTRGA